MDTTERLMNEICQKEFGCEFSDLADISGSGMHQLRIENLARYLVAMGWTKKESE